jgi:small subunit ribosomal protein S16
MATKIRLQRHGRKGNPFYYIVVADSRARRDGNFVQKLGTYNPIKNPAIIELDIDASVSWLEKGAQPTDTARSILAREGVLFKKHLKGGVQKGAFDEAEMNKKFDAWKEAKVVAIQEKANSESQKKIDRRNKQIEDAKQAIEAKLAEEKAAAAAVEAERIAAEEAQKAEVEAVVVEEPEAVVQEPEAETESPASGEPTPTEGE